MFFWEGLGRVFNVLVDLVLVRFLLKCFEGCAVYDLVNIFPFLSFFQVHVSFFPFSGLKLK